MNRTQIKTLLTASLFVGLSSASYAEVSIANESAIVRSVSQNHTQSDVNRHDAMRLEKVLREAGIKADIKSIKPSSIPDLFAVTLADQPPLYISRDGHYVVQGEVLSVPDDVILEIQNDEMTANANSTLSNSLSSASQPPFDKALNGTRVSQALRASMLPYLMTFDGITADIPLYHTAVDGLIWGASIDGMPFITTKTGKTIIDGEIALLENGEFVGLDATFERRKNKEVLSKLDADELIIYPATAPEVQTIYVATDLNCPYCQQLHTMIEELNAKGVTVNVIGYPVFDESFEPMRQIWCETDNAERKRLFDEAMLGMQATLQTTLPNCSDNRLQANRDVSAGLAVFATPAIYRADGTMYQGHFAKPEFEAFLKGD